MSSQSIPTEALNVYDDHSFINGDNSRRKHEYDSTRRPVFPPATDRGFNFQPFNVERRDIKVNQLPQEPLYLFQYFVPLFLLNSWVKYTNEDIYLRWIWHQPGAKHGPIGIERPKKKEPASQTGRGGRGRGRGRERGKASREREASDADKVEEVIHVLTDDGDKVITLNSTQSVVIALINLLPKSIYHVFVDNLFSSPGLFLSLRQHGHGATGTARPNCGIFKELVDAKKNDKSGKSGFKFNEIKVIPTPGNQVNQIA
ncbi:hypothetical protein FOQG_16467 [Fusarium oxysporum f. sp. raphani 54005]|uniref:PiggyBac transposable element-derived protein domain-containing protein n=1 Tax=Fusarium oxysporum f. sp. raphani 54005 TaxID=1089458 RepID=X0BJ31_FUSOX|nr:hypothetical protein FOQG_16467 [Fusarium oxysporum f. sp. raphani 54005]